MVISALEKGKMRKEHSSFRLGDLAIEIGWPEKASLAGDIKGTPERSEGASRGMSRAGEFQTERH